MAESGLAESDVACKVSAVVPHMVDRVFVSSALSTFSLSFLHWPVSVSASALVFIGLGSVGNNQYVMFTMPDVLSN